MREAVGLVLRRLAVGEITALRGKLTALAGTKAQSAGDESTLKAALTTLDTDIIALGAIVAEEVYGLVMPVVVVPPEAFEGLETGAMVAVGVDGGAHSSGG